MVLSSPEAEAPSPSSLESEHASPSCCLQQRVCQSPQSCPQPCGHREGVCAASPQPRIAPRLSPTPAAASRLPSFTRNPSWTLRGKRAGPHSGAGCRAGSPRDLRQVGQALRKSEAGNTAAGCLAHLDLKLLRQRLSLTCTEPAVPAGASNNYRNTGN